MNATLTHLALHVVDMEASVNFYHRYCGMRVIHERDNGHIRWMAEAGREQEMIFVLMAGGNPVQHIDPDYAHMGFALDSREAVDRVARQAEEEGILIWPPREDPYPVGYYCGVTDPSGNYVEFSYGQPLGPGAEAADRSISD